MTHQPDPAAAPLDLLTIGETMVLVAPRAGESLGLDAAVTLSAGGAESNVAIAAAAAGVNAGWYSRLGAGPLGDLVRDSIKSRGVDTSRVHTDAGLPTGLMVKHPSATGSQTYYYRAGTAASTMSPHDLPDLPQARIVHISGIMAALSPSCRDLSHRIAHGALAPSLVSFDINYRPALWSDPAEASGILLELARNADVVFVGRDEAESLWGVPTAEAIRALLPRVPHLIVKDGDVEAVEFADDDVTRVQAHRVDVIEPVGAGDAFAAGWLSHWIRGANARTRLTAGHDAAAAVLRSPTDQAPIKPRHQNVETS